MSVGSSAQGEKCITCQHYLIERKMIGKNYISHDWGGKCGLTKTLSNPSQSCKKWVKWDAIK